MSTRSRLKTLETKTRNLCVKNTDEAIEQIQCQLDGGHKFVFDHKEEDCMPAKGEGYKYVEIFWFKCKCGKWKKCQEANLTAKEKVALKTLKFI